MKREPNIDFPISVRSHVWEESQNVAHFYKGIYDVTMRSGPMVMFIPDFEREQIDWPPALNENSDLIQNQLEARLTALSLAEYAVSPNTHLAGKEEKISWLNPEVLGTTVIFYVSPEEFERVSVELSAASEEFAGITDTKPISEYSETRFAKLILTRIIPSPYFSDSARKLLGT
jgi:hypothetical protein